MARKKTTAPVEEPTFMSDIDYNIDADLFATVASSGTAVALDSIPERPKLTRVRKSAPNPFRIAVSEAFGNGTAMCYTVPGAALKKVTDKLRNAAQSENLSLTMTITDQDGTVVSFTRKYIAEELPSKGDEAFTIYAQPVPRRTRSKTEE